MDITMRNSIATPALTALTANTATPIEWPESDEKMVLVINASADTTLTVLAGNSIQGVADLTVSVPKGVNLIKLESGRFKNVSGENKGKIVVKSAGTPSVGVAALV
jgi:hypothetical protein